MSRSRWHRYWHYNKECKWYRKHLVRKNRSKTKQLIHHEKYDMVVGPHRTSGWFTW